MKRFKQAICILIVMLLPLQFFAYPVLDKKDSLGPILKEDKKYWLQIIGFGMSIYKGVQQKKLGNPTAETLREIVDILDGINSKIETLSDKMDAVYIYMTTEMAKDVVFTNYIAKAQVEISEYEKLVRAYESLLQSGVKKDKALRLTMENKEVAMKTHLMEVKKISSYLSKYNTPFVSSLKTVLFQVILDYEEWTNTNPIHTEIELKEFTSYYLETIPVLEELVDSMRLRIKCQKACAGYFRYTGGYPNLSAQYILVKTALDTNNLLEENPNFYYMTQSYSVLDSLSYIKPETDSLTYYILNDKQTTLWQEKNLFVTDCFENNRVSEYTYTDGRKGAVLEASNGQLLNVSDASTQFSKIQIEQKLLVIHYLTSVSHCYAGLEFCYEKLTSSP